MKDIKNETKLFFYIKITKYCKILFFPCPDGGSVIGERPGPRQICPIVVWK